MPFQPGNSGYPEDQRRARMFVAALRMEIAAAGPDALRRVARALIAEACKGNVAAATMIADRLDGKVPQPRGGSDELGPQRLQISWDTHQRQGAQSERTLAAPATAEPLDAKSE